MNPEPGLHREAPTSCTRLSPKWEVGDQLDFDYLKDFEHFEGYYAVPIAISAGFAV